MVELTQKTLGTIVRLRKYRGHLLNWYDTRTLEAKPPFFVSSVDSGNLVASLWTLQQGSLDRLRQPILSSASAEALLDHVRTLVNLRALPKRVLSRCKAEFQGEDWLTSVLNFPEELLDDKNPRAESDQSSDIAWFREQTGLRFQKIRDLVRAYIPWKLPEFAALRKELVAGGALIDDVPLQQLPDLISELEARLDNALGSSRNGNTPLGERLKPMLVEARQNALRLIADLRANKRTGTQPGKRHGLQFLAR